MNDLALRPAEDPGQVRLTFTDVLRVPDMDPLTYEEWSRVVACPACGASTGITLEARGSSTVAICPRTDGCGRAWRADDALSAQQIRQIRHFQLQGADVVVPHPTRVTVMMVPPLEDDDVALQNAPEPSATPDPSLQWAMRVSVVAGGAAPLTVALGWARGLLSWSLPSDGELYGHLYPAAGGSALDAHMTQVVLGLAIHEAARHQDADQLNLVELEAIAEQLDGDNPNQLRGARPHGLGRRGGRLRLSDISRLETASTQQWDLWSHLAGEVIADHCRDGYILHKDTKGSTLPLTARIKPWPGRLGTCRSRFQDPALDLTWYQGTFPGAPHTAGEIV